MILESLEEIFFDNLFLLPYTYEKQIKIHLDINLRDYLHYHQLHYKN